MKPISGLEAIGEYVGRSPITIKRWIRDRGFPASWVAERWYALPEKINGWIEAQEWQEGKQGLKVGFPQRPKADF